MPNDPRQRRSRRHALRPHGPLPPALASLALWLLLLIAFPLWLIVALVASLLVGCVAGAVVPSLPGHALGGSRVRTAGLARGS